ncbi:MAG TPA: hypothetical protein VFQ61_18810 [Polyangiaceae bacterium]|nr:hypothetical protein [Polyangiaceae bacterium]
MSPQVTLALSVLGLAGSGCVELPEPPPEGRDLSARYREYDHPTGEVPDSARGQLFQSALILATSLRAFSGLVVVRSLISDSSVAGAGYAVEGSLVQGSLKASVDCAKDPMHPEIAGGHVELLLGIRGSRISRALNGAVVDCRLLVTATDVAQVNSDLTIDLGAELELGEVLRSPILVRAENVDLGGETSGVHDVNIEFRIQGYDVLESLVDMQIIGIPGTGSVVVQYRRDGWFGVVEKRGIWTCAGTGEPACVLKQ